MKKLHLGKLHLKWFNLIEALGVALLLTIGILFFVPDKWDFREEWGGDIVVYTITEEGTTLSIPNVMALERNYLTHKITLTLDHNTKLKFDDEEIELYRVWDEFGHERRYDSWKHEVPWR